jgi:hypothetical protein
MGQIWACSGSIWHCAPGRRPRISSLSASGPGGYVVSATAGGSLAGGGPGPWWSSATSIQGLCVGDDDDEAGAAAPGTRWQPGGASTQRLCEGRWISGVPRRGGRVVAAPRLVSDLAATVGHCVWQVAIAGTCSLGRGVPWRLDGSAAAPLF